MSATVPIIGFVGGVASGKSALARWLGERLSVCVVDADQAGHRALMQPTVRDQLRQRLGSDIFEANETVNRAKLATLIFGETAEHKQRRFDLESIVHPMIAVDCEQQIQQAQQSGTYDVIVLDAAVMLESGWNRMCDRIYFVEVPAPVRRQRASEHRGWGSDELIRREASQWSLDRKRQAADAIIDNSQDIDHAGEQLLQDMMQRGLIEAGTPTSNGT